MTKRLGAGPVELGSYRSEYLNDSDLCSGSGAEAGAYVIVTPGE
jgi:hypothetical protein